MEKVLLNDPEWIEHYSSEQLGRIEDYANNVNSNVIVFKCSCCDEWSGCFADNYDIILPINKTSKEEIIDWCKDRNFHVIGEVVNEDKVILYN